MRRLALCVVFLALTGPIVTVLVARSRANDPPAAPPRPAAKTPDAEDPFAAPAAVASPQTKSAAAPPKPVAPASSRPADEAGHAGGMASADSSMLLPSPDRIFTPEMAAAPESKEAFDALSSAECAADAAIVAALASPAEIDCNEMPLAQLVTRLKKCYKIEIELDAAGLKDAGVEPDTPVTKHLSRMTLRSTLRLLLDDLQLKYVIHNEVLLITSPTKAESDEFMLTKFYPVKDLVLVRNDRDEIQTEMGPLMDLIRDIVDMKSWIDNGGNGTMSPYVFQDHCLIVVSQTQEVHEEIGDLLAALRRFAAAEGKGGKELRLPKLPKHAAPAHRTVPASQGLGGSPTTAAPGKGPAPMGGGLGGMGGGMF